MTNEQLVARIQSGMDVSENMAVLWQQNKGFLAKMAMKYQAYGEFDDLMQEGYLGLCQAVDGYDPDAGASFIHYAAYWIRRAMLFYIRSNGTIRIPVNLHAQISRYEQLRTAFLSELGREPDNREIGSYLGVSDKSVAGLKKAARMRQIASLDSPVRDTDGELTVGDTVPDPADLEAAALETVQQEQLKATLWGMVDELPGQCPEVISRYYRDGESIKEIGDTLGVIPGRVYQIKQQALRELRRSDRARRLSPYAREYIDTHAYSGSGVESFNRTWTSSTERTALGLAERV